MGKNGYIFKQKVVSNGALTKKRIFVEKSYCSLFFLKSKIANFVAIICCCESVSLASKVTRSMIDF